MRRNDSRAALIIGGALIGMGLMLMMVVIAPVVVRAFQ